MLTMATSSPLESTTNPSSVVPSGGMGDERRLRTTALAWSLWTIAIPIGVSAVSALDQVLRRYPATKGAWDSIGDVGFIVAALVGGTVGAVVASRRPRNPVGWLFLAMAALIVLSGGLEKWGAYGLFGRPGKVRGAAVAAALAESQFVLFLGVLALVLLLTPTGHLPSRRWRPVALLAAVLPLMTFPVMVLAPRQLEAPFQGTPNVLGIEGLGWLVPVAELMLMGIMAVQLLSAASLVVRFRHSRGVERQQLLWVVFGAGVMLAGVIAQVVIVVTGLGQDNDSAAVVAGVFFAAIPLTTGVAILQYRLYDLGRLVSRAVAWTVLSALLLAVYSLTVLVVGRLAGRAGGSSSVAVAVGTLAAALAFGSARRRVQDAVDRRFNRRRWHALRVVDAFTHRSPDARADETIEAVLARALGDPSLYVAYWLPRRQEWVDAEGHPRTVPEDEARIVRVERDRELIAAVVHDPALEGGRGLVEAAAAAAAPELESSRLRAEVGVQLVEVQASRARIVAAGDSERRRIERNLHDGAQQQLVALAINLRLARQIADDDPDASKAMLDELGSQLQEAVQELRNLAHGIYPPLLMERGLADALQAAGSR
nr:histidine kinase dimerization/phosphoacceptor domain-containing protein [Actinomycetota bacterium]